MATIGVILNPNAGGNGAAAQREAEFRSALGGRGVVIRTTSLAQLPEAARELVARRIEVLAVCGGDGSFHHTLTACIPAFGEGPLPYLLPLPAGSMNTIARSFGWRRRSLAESLAAVARSDDLRRSCRVVEREVIRINGWQYGFMFGAGVIVNFLAAYYSQRTRGPLGAAQLVTRLVGSGLVGGELGRQLFTSVQAEVSCDGTVLPRKSFNIVYAATVTELGLGFRVTYRAGTEPGRFHLLAGEPNLAQLVWRLPHIKQGWPINAAQLHDDLGSSLIVEFEQPTRYMIDGEILEPIKRLELEVGPRLAILI